MNFWDLFSTKKILNIIGSIIALLGVLVTFGVHWVVPANSGGTVDLLTVTIAALYALKTYLSSHTIFGKTSNGNGTPAPTP